jgi:DNA-binding transcriptional LysR family regulator
VNLAHDILRTFVTVAETRNFTRAADIVHRTQSAVSQQIRKLEEETGHELFTRNGRAVELTAAGETLLPYARRILRAQDEAASMLLRPEVTGLVKLGGPDDLMPRFLPAILARFAGIHPRVQVEVHCGASRQMLAMLEQGTLDLVVYNCGDIPGSGEVIGRDRLVWATSALHLTHEQDPLPVALFAQGCLYRQWALQALESSGKPYRVAYTSPSIAGIQTAVSSGMAVAPMASKSLAENMRILTVEEGFPELPTFNISLHRKSGALSKAVECLSDFLADGIRQSLPAPPN